MQIIILFLAGAEVNDGTSLLEGQHAGRGSARRDWAAPSPTRKRSGGRRADARAYNAAAADEGGRYVSLFGFLS